MKPLITPTVNINGTAGSELIAQRMRAVRLLDETIVALTAYRPHGRDYQHLIRGDDCAEHRTTVSDAQDAWQERITALVEIRNDLTHDAHAIHEQNKGRRS